MPKSLILWCVAVLGVVVFDLSAAVAQVRPAGTGIQSEPAPALEPERETGDRTVEIRLSRRPNERGQIVGRGHENLETKTRVVKVRLRIGPAPLLSQPDRRVHQTTAEIIRDVREGVQQVWRIGPFPLREGEDCEKSIDQDVPAGHYTVLTVSEGYDQKMQWDGKAKIWFRPASR